MRHDHRELARLAAAMTECATTLDAPLHATRDDAPEVERVRRLLRRTSADIAAHSSATRRLDDEIDLLVRRRSPDPRTLADLQRRRAQSDARLTAAVDAATRALVPGGDRIDPVTILRRLSGAEPAGRRSYFGRAAVDRTDRLRRLGTFLLHGRPTSHLPRDHRPPTVIVTPRATRLARVRHRLLRSVHARHTTGARP